MAHRKRIEQQLQVIEAQPLPTDVEFDGPSVILLQEDLNQLSPLLSSNVSDRDELFRAVERLSTISVDGISITLEPYLLNRLKSRCLDKARFPQWLGQVVKQQLCGFCGC